MSKFFVECRFYKSVVFTVISVIKMDAVAVLVSDRLKGRASSDENQRSR